VKRITGRRMCRCGATFHEEFNPPKEENLCDQCKGRLYQRDDDKEETVLQRLEVYRSQTEPLVEYYGKSGIVHDFDGNRPIDQISSEIITFLTRLEG
jgi:adenylate kinase